jgi:hypothetical protein
LSIFIISPGPKGCDENQFAYLSGKAGTLQGWGNQIDFSEKKHK